MERTVSAQAFSKARRNFSHKAFLFLNQKLIGLLDKIIGIPRWHGLRVVAADGSKGKISMFKNGVRQTIDVLFFSMYLPSVEMSLQFAMHSIHDSERQVLFESLHLLDKNDILVLDRGYPCLWLFACLIQRKINFCMRIDKLKFKQVKRFAESTKSETIVKFRAPSKNDCRAFGCKQKSIKLRLVRIRPKEGKEYIVVTSLRNKKKYKAQDFMDLYHQRWRIEESYKRIKHRINLEHVSTFDPVLMQQDVSAKMLTDNINALAVLCANEEQVENRETHQKINRNYTFAHLKSYLSRWLLVKLPKIKKIKEIFEELNKNTIIFVKEASKERKKKTKPHKYHAYKPKS